ncbi:MAG: DivIVA domain-containing protein [Spirosomaceae bacterium]|nr:DivIVA domain-containing protein [Spirosomataceae bacterium]
MKITPLEIRQHEFEKTFRGYNIEEVDNFLSNLAQEWERILNESKMLRMQLEIAEKEASKLREIEMTLFKTLKTAEDTSNMITEQANQQAEKHVQESRLKSEEIVSEAQSKAATIIRQAEERAKYIKDEVLSEVRGLERDFKAMDHYKSNLLVQMRSLANATIEHVDRFENKFDKEGIEAKFTEATTMLAPENADIPLEIVKPIAEELEVPKVEALVEDVIETTEPIAEPIVEETIAEVNEIIEPEKTIGEVMAKVETETEVVTAEVSQVEEKIEEFAETETAVEQPIFEEPIAEIEPIAKTKEVVEDLVEEVKPEPIVETVIASSSVNSLANNYGAEKSVFDEPKIDDLTIIEGIGPKIADLLNNNNIITFADLAKTPPFKVKEILENAGSHYAMHDPSTWTEQALLAATGRFDELEALKDRLIGGREVEEEILPQPEPVVVPEPVVEQPLHFPPADTITEDMLEKVNKVKAAIRKAMAEKSENQPRDNTPLPTVSDVMQKNEGGSFFDNL